jgi:hypothetical protein
MSKHRLRWGLGLVAVVGVVGIAAFLLGPRSPVNPDNFEKIQVGMTLAEVEDILGGPGRPVSVWNRSGRRNAAGELAQETCRVWEGGETVITIFFDEQGVVLEKEIGHQPGSMLDRFRRWLGR